MIESEPDAVWRVTKSGKAHAYRSEHPACGGMPGMWMTARKSLFHASLREATEGDHRCKDCIRLTKAAPCACPRCVLERNGKEAGQRARLIEAIRLRKSGEPFRVVRAEDGTVVSRFATLQGASRAAKRYSRMLGEVYRAELAPCNHAGEHSPACGD